MLKLNGVLIYNLDQQNCINKILKLGKGPLNPKSGPAPWVQITLNMITGIQMSSYTPILWGFVRKLRHNFSINT